MAENIYKKSRTMTVRTSKRFHEIITEDARRVAAEWCEISVEDAKAMLALTIEAMRNGESLPEPAEFAKAQLRNHMTSKEVEIAWPEMVRKIGCQLSITH